MRADSAPSPDGLTVREFKKIHPAITALILNNWLSHHHLPDELRESRTVFIPKTSSAATFSQLRPIPISSVIVCLFTRLILSRVQETYSFKLLQNGFLGDRCAQSNLLLLQGVMRYCKQECKPFFYASLDLQKVFDSVSHHALFTALVEGGAHDSYVCAVRDLYSAQFTTFSYNGTSDGVRVFVERGIKQGDPLSPFLFNMTLDPLLNSLNSSGFGVHLSQPCIAAMAYADDLVLMASTYSELIRNLEVAQKHFKNMGLKTNKKPIFWLDV